MPPAPAAALDRDLSRAVRGARFAFLDAVEPCRDDLWRYCRALTRSPWDADDLVQEALARAFAKVGQLQAPIDDPRRWLLRVATNAWIDRRRRDAASPVGAPGDEVLEAVPDEAPPRPSDEVREALAVVVRTLPAQERAAVVLKDVFDLSLDETAAWLETTRGAVKAALHRARGKLAARGPDAAPVGADPAADPAVLDRFVAAFNARDLAGLAALLREDATAEVTGMVQEYGRAQVRDGSLHHTLFDEEGDPRAERVEVLGAPVVVLWYTKGGARAVEDVLRLTTDEAGWVTTLRYAYFCPEVVREVAQALGAPARTNGHRYIPR